MKSLTEESIALLRKMVAIPSPSFGEAEVCSLISAQLDNWGVKHERIRDNIVAANLCGMDDAPTLVLDAHIDTVPAASGYTRDPFDSGDGPSVIYGLGSNDDGGSVAAMIAAFRQCLDKKNPFNLILALTCQEERSGADGSRFLYSAEGPFSTGIYPRPSAIIVGEPTGMRAATSERGLLVLDAVAHGVSGHAARNEGINALYIAMDDIRKLRDHTFVKKSPIMGDVRLNVTQIESGSAHNVIPDKCSFVVDIRPNEKYTNAELLEELQAECKSTLTARNLTNRSSSTDPEGFLMRAVNALGLEQFSSPTTSDWVRIPYDAVKIGPGDSSRSHKADEYIMAAEIEQAVEIYVKLIEAYGNSLE
jgi:Acetylornithine deacetylase/Succinyl-diaminopimelate desuccinylase and related deacylases